MNSHRKAKNKQLTQLASEVTEGVGVIVELGAYQGEGTLALCRGANNTIIAIDDFADRQGWAGENYRPIDEWVFKNRLINQNIILINNDIILASQDWVYGSIGLLVWDLGIPDRLQGDFEQWQDKVSGKFVVHDTDDQRLGSKELNPIGWRKYKEGVFWILERL